MPISNPAFFVCLHFVLFGRNFCPPISQGKGGRSFHCTNYFSRRRILVTHGQSIRIWGDRVGRNFKRGGGGLEIAQNALWIATDSLLAAVFHRGRMKNVEKCRANCRRSTAFWASPTSLISCVVCRVSVLPVYGAFPFPFVRDRVSIFFRGWNLRLTAAWSMAIATYFRISRRKNKGGVAGKTCAAPGFWHVLCHNQHLLRKETRKETVLSYLYLRVCDFMFSLFEIWAVESSPLDFWRGKIGQGVFEVVRFFVDRSRSIFPSNSWHVRFPGGSWRCNLLSSTLIYYYFNMSVFSWLESICNWHDTEKECSDSHRTKSINQSFVPEEPVQLNYLRLLRTEKVLSYDFFVSVCFWRIQMHFYVR